MNIQNIKVVKQGDWKNLLEKESAVIKQSKTAIEYYSKDGFILKYIDDHGIITNGFDEAFRIKHSLISEIGRLRK